MKKITCFVLSLLMMLNVFPACIYASGSFEGDGTAEDPYIIADAEDYNTLSAEVKGGESFSGKYFAQTADFEFENAPVGGTEIYGMGDYEFAGIYDGKGYTITLADDYKEVEGDASFGIKKVEGGLFGNLTGIVKNVTVTGSWRLEGNGGIIAKMVSGEGKIINCGITNFKALHAYDPGTILYGLASTDGYDGTAIINCFGYYAEYNVSSGENFPLTDNDSAIADSYYYIKSTGSWEGGSVAESAGNINEAEMSELHTVLNANIAGFAGVAGVDKSSLMLWASDGTAPVSTKEYYVDTDELINRLQGAGTAENPYDIASATDYKNLSAAVKAGVNFQGKYFAQTADFEFDNAPAGQTAIYGMGDCGFAGIYDGQGYTITLADDYKEVEGDANIGIKKVEGGLFGNLTGIVKNVTVTGSWRLSGNGGIIAKKVTGEGKIINCGVTDFKALHAYDSGTILYGLASTEGYDGTAIINCFGYYAEYNVSSGENFPLTDNDSAIADSYYYIKSTGSWEGGSVAESAGNINEAEMSELHTVLNANIAGFAGVAGADKTSLMLWERGENAPVSTKEYYVVPPVIVYEFDGEGTAENPYIIADVADYQMLANAVKGGVTFSGEYFAQTADFEFDNAPSGETAIYGMGDSEFAGIYDGKGHAITLADDYKEVVGEDGLGTKKIEGGLFGNLTGIVKNVTVTGSWRLSGNGGIIAKKVTGEGKIINCGVTDFKALHAYDSGTILYGLASTEGYEGTAIINCFGYYAEYNVSSGENFPLTDNDSAIADSYYYIKSTGSWEGGSVAESAGNINEAEMSELHTVLNANIAEFAGVAGADKTSLMLWERGENAPVSAEEYYVVPPAIVYEFDGEGTAESPYIIADMADYQMLANAVKGGVNFQGKYFAQTADFEFDNAPSGETAIYGMGDSEFAGIYDGKGYTITLADDYKEIKDEDGLGTKKIEGGLFGNLTGIVKNVTVTGSWRLSGNGGIIAKKVTGAGKIINCGVTDFKALHAYDSGTILYGLASTEGYDGTAIINCFGYYEEYNVSSGENYPVTDNGNAALNCYYCIKTPGYWEGGTIAENAGQKVTETKMSSLHSVLNENIGVFEPVSGFDKYSLMVWKNGGAAPVSKGEYYTDPVKIDYDFKGEGTYENPYLIETIADYNKMTDYIKSGSNFKGKFFAQTGDIAFETAKKDQELVYGLSEGDEFAGTYNGNGYSITLGTHYNHIAGYAPEDTGITMLNQGLFGKLSGVVMNVVIRGIWRMKDDGGLIAHTVVDNGKIINCGTRNFGIWAIFGTHSFYGFASTKDYEGTAIYNCFFNSHYSSSPGAQISFITDTDAYKDCWYHLGRKDSGGIVDWTKGKEITADELKTLHNELNDRILENAKAAGVPAVDLKLWKPSEAAGTPIVENYELATIPVPDNKTFTHISIESEDAAGAGRNYPVNALTYFKDSDKIEIKIDGEKVLEYVVDGVYENIKEIPAQYITEGKHTVTVCGISGGEVIYSAEKAFVADAGYAKNVVTAGSLESGSTVSVSLDVENCLAEPSDITLLLGVYNEKGGLVAYEIVKYPAVTGEKTDASVSLVLPAGDYNGAKALLYVWDNLKSMKAMMSGISVLE